MVTANDIGADFAGMIREAGVPIRFRYFNASYGGAGSGYDDDLSLVQSGADYWVSGVVQPIGAPKGSAEAVLLQEGRLTAHDQKLYVAGSVPMSGQWRVGLGSPSQGEYALLDDGVTAWEVGGNRVYQKAYIRRLPTGSLLGE
jgi:hypothetical protein